MPFRRRLQAPIGPPSHNVGCDHHTHLMLSAIVRQMGPAWTLKRATKAAAVLLAKQLEIHDEVLQDIEDYRNLVREKPYQFVKPRHIEMVERLNRDRGNA